MIIPIGHDKGLRRLPIVTLIIIVICALLQLHRALYTPSDKELVPKLEARLALVDRIMSDLRDRDVEVAPDAIERGDYRGIDHPRLAELRRVDKEIEAISHRDLAMRLGWAPDMGLTPNLILYAFVHADWFHLIGNMLFLWLAGMAIEDRWGHFGFLLFYLVASATAAGAYALWHPGSGDLVVGASGAVAGCMGAFLIVYAGVRIRFWYAWGLGVIVHGTFYARALYALPIWFAEEALYAYFERDNLDAVAHSAHVGGFAFGLLMALVLKYSGFEKQLMLAEEVEEEWSNDNPALEDGLTFERNGQKVAALGRFLQVLAHEPDHPTARMHALDCALELRDLATARALADGGVRAMLREGRRDDVPMIYAKLREAGLAAALGERTLAEIARLCLPSEAYAPLGVQVVRQLLDAPEPSLLLPGLLWQVAEVQAGAGRPDLATRTLSTLVDRFPMDPFADHARTRVAELRAATPIAPG